jgi:2-succinyl-5-enolpyruvyl-6-hydroxy-3-cyclohexene-1-carboxylate synthase
MYSDKENINILTALLVAHGVRHAVVSPGSRNAPIVHNLDACSSIECYPVTDERSAGFYALGIALETGLPTVVCVTSGTALLDLAPAVAEAYYQHVPLVVVSADRPLQWIDQLDGQTLPQGDALGRFVRKAVTLPMILRDEHLMVATRATPTEEPEPLKRRQEISWYCNRLVNEALLAAKQDGGGPVQINVPLDRPLYNFTTPELPQERKIELLSLCKAVDASPMLQQLYAAKRPVIVIGQLQKHEISEEIIDQLVKHRYIVLQETLSGVYAHNVPFRGLEELQRLSEKEDAVVYPDFILYVGRTLVSQKLKQYLRDAKNAVCWRVDERGEIADTFMNLTGVIQAKVADVLKAIDKDAPLDWHDAWENIQLNVGSYQKRCSEPQYSSVLAVKKLEEIIGSQDIVEHYANSMAVRYGCLFAKHHILCNRGVNGIDGSLSTAAGNSLVTGKNVYCVIGDLSFFYDRNALWNRNLRGNLRILLLNNGGGGIFEKFSEHLQDKEDACNVMAQYYTSAEGFCADNHIEYHFADDEESLESGLKNLTCPVADRPIVLEVRTKAKEDWENYQIK